VTCPGFRFAGVAAGIKKKGGLDVGLIAADAPAAAAAVFTGNRVKAAPVVLSAAALRAAKGKLRGVVVNSGNANACTGKAGMADAKAMAAAAAAAAPSATPQAWQCRASSALTAPQAAHSWRCSAVPHSMQNLAPLALARLQCGQINCVTGPTPRFALFAFNSSFLVACRAPSHRLARGMVAEARTPDRPLSRG